MSHETQDSGQPKISAEFSARLALLGPRQKIRAIVMLDVQVAKASSRRRLSQQERKALIEAMQESSGSALKEIDGILQRFEGKRLAARVDALGSVPVEAPPAGIKALAASKQIKAVLEDQPISLIRKPKD